MDDVRDIRDAWKLNTGEWLTKREDLKGKQGDILGE